MNLLLLAVLLAGALQVSEPARALALHFADGKTVYEPIHAGRRMYATILPRIDGAETGREGKRLYALDITQRIDRNELVADLALLYGGVNDVKVPIGTIPLAPGSATTLDLTSFGLQPIRFSVVDIAPLENMPLPRVHAPSPDLEVQVRAIPGAIPRYGLTVTNRGSKPIITFRMLAYQDGHAQPASRRLSKPDDVPVAMPGESYAFEQRPLILSGPADVPAWRVPTRFEIVDVVWLDVDQTIADYCAAWSEPDIARRRELLTKVWAPGGMYTDPAVHLVGHPNVLNYITGFHQRFPGVKIVVTSQVDFHHGVGRFSWRMIEGSSNAPLEGIDFVEFAPDGRIRRIVGFFGPFKPK